MAELKLGEALETADARLLVENLPPGRHVFELRVADESGNLSRPARVAVQVFQQGPRVTSFDPEFGWPGDKAIVWVTGLHPDLAKNEIFFQGARAQVTGGSSRTLHAVVPETRTGPVSVVNGAGQGVSDSPFFIPRRIRLAAPNASDMAFVPASAFLALLSEGADKPPRCGLWLLPEKFAAEKNPPFAAPAAEALLALPASRLTLVPNPEKPFALAWEPGQDTANLLRWEERTAQLSLDKFAFRGRTLELLAGPAGPFGLFEDREKGQFLHSLGPNGRMAPVPETLSLLCADAAGKSVFGLAASGRVFQFHPDTWETLASWESPGDVQVLRLAACSGKAGVWGYASKPPRAFLFRGKETRALDLGFAPGSMAAHPSGRQAFFSGDGARLIAVYLPENPGEKGLSARVLNLPFPAPGPALSMGGRGGHFAVLHGRDKAATFFNAATFRQGLCLPLPQAPLRALSSPDGSLHAVALEKGIEVIEAAGVAG